MKVYLAEIRKCISYVIMQKIIKDVMMNLDISVVQNFSGPVFSFQFLALGCDRA